MNTFVDAYQISLLLGLAKYWAWSGSNLFNTLKEANNCLMLLKPIIKTVQLYVLKH